MAEPGSKGALHGPGRLQQIGRYRIRERIGKGAMGLVYAARDEAMGRDVAVKVMLADLEDEPDIRARFLREAQVAGRLMHRNIVTIFDAGEEDGCLYIVMELLRGVTLGDYLKRPDGGLEAKLGLMVQICEGLAVASGAGVYHRDVKPGNLFVQADGTLKILDFGIARLASSNMTASGFIVGTPDYMSPEQARGEEVDERSDIFSAGSVFYFMLTGRKPFAAPDLPAVLKKVMLEDPLPLRDIEAPPSLGRVVARALAKDPAARYQRFRDLLGDLVRVSRRYDADTKAQAAAAFVTWQAIQAMSDERAQCADGLGVPAPTPVSELLTPIATEHPHLVARGFGALKTVPLGRAVIDRVTRRLDALQLDVAEHTSLVREARRRYESGLRCQATGDFGMALRHFEEALQLVPDAEVLPRMVAECRERAAERQAADDRVAALLRQSAECRSEGRLEAALALAQQAVAIQEDSAVASAAVARLRDELARAAEERTRTAAEHLDRARRAAAKGRFDDAVHELVLARAAGADPAPVDALEQEVAAQQRARAADDAHKHMLVETVASAWAMLRAGDAEAAIAALEHLHREHPGADLGGELRRLKTDAARLADEARRRAEATAASQAASAAWERGDIAEALRFAESALALRAGDASARQIADAARARFREQALRDARLGRAAAHLETARTELERGRFDRARREASRAAELDPENEAPGAIAVEATRRQMEADAAQARQLAATQRGRAARGSLAAAEAALDTQDFVRARWAAENALAIDPENARAREILEIAMAAPAFAPQDETIDDRSPVDPDDTASVRMDRGFGHAENYVAFVRGSFRMARDAASRKLAQLRSSRGPARPR